MIQIAVALIGVVSVSSPVVLSWLLSRSKKQNTIEHAQTMQVNRENQELLYRVIETQGAHGEKLEVLDERLTVVEDARKPRPLPFGAGRPFGASPSPKVVLVAAPKPK